MTTRDAMAADHDRWSDRLSAYLDGELDARERGRMEAHLAECAACAVALAGLREVVSRAHALEPAPPATDLWPAIEAQLEPRATPARRGVVLAGPSWWGRRFELGLPQLAAAAMLLVGLSAGAMWLMVRGPALPAGPALTPRTTSSIPRGLAPSRTADGGVADNAFTPRRRPGTIAGANDLVPATSAAAGLDNPGYDAAVAELEQALAQGRGKLDPRTLEVVEQNLNIIDRAIGDAQRAVAADPGNTWLRSHLAATMKRKVDLLRSATLLASAQG